MANQRPKSKNRLNLHEIMQNECNNLTSGNGPADIPNEELKQNKVDSLLNFHKMHTINEAASNELI